MVDGPTQLARIPIVMDAATRQVEAPASFHYDAAPLKAAHQERKFKRLPAGVVWLAGQIGKSIATVSRVLNGKCTSPSTVGLTCDVLGVDREAIRPKADAGGHTQPKAVA